MRPYSINPDPGFPNAYKKAGPSRPPRRSKQKACDQCAKSKARCDLSQPSCSRCKTHRRACHYSSSSADHSQIEAHTLNAPDDIVVASDPASQGDHAIPESSSTLDSPNWKSQDLATNPSSRVDMGRSLYTPSTTRSLHRNLTMSLRWLSSFDEAPQVENLPVTKSMSKSARYFCSKYLATLPFGVTSSEKTSPLVHASHLHPIPKGRLVNAITIINMSRNQIAGSEELVLRTISMEMEAIINDAVLSLKSDALSLFQSYLLLAILACYHLPPQLAMQAITIETLVNLETLANLADSSLGQAGSKAGLRNPTSCSTSTQPRDNDGQSESHPTGRQTQERHALYVQVESLRRAIFAACVFDNIWNATVGFQIIQATDLGELSAPCSSKLWGCQDSDVWEDIWRHHLQSWSTSVTPTGSMTGAIPSHSAEASCVKGASLQDPGLRLSELWAHTRPDDRLGEARFDRWLSEGDEYGLWLFGVCEMMGTGRGHVA